MPSWKTAQSKRKNNKKVKLAIFALGLIVGLVLLSHTLKFAKMIFGQKASSWNGQSNINLVLKSDPISLLSYNPKDEKVTIIKIPNQTYFEVSSKLGKWQMDSVYPLGGGELLKSSLANFFGLPISGFLENTSLEQLTDKNPLSIFSVLEKTQTDLTPYELLKLKMGLSSVRFDKIKQIDLEDLGLLEKENLADGTEVLGADVLRLDSLSEEFLDPSIKLEGKTIAIFNCTSHPGLALKAARIIANIGGDVIIVSNGEKRLEKSVILGDKSNTLERLKQIFVSNDTIEPGLEELVSPRAQINLFLGENYFNSL